MELAQNRDHWGLGCCRVCGVRHRVLLPEQCLFNVSLLVYYPLYSVQGNDMKFFVVKCSYCNTDLSIPYRNDLSPFLPACCVYQTQPITAGQEVLAFYVLVLRSKLSRSPIATRGNKDVPKFIKRSLLYILSRPPNSSCGNSPHDLHKDCSFSVLLLDKVQMLLKFFTNQHHSLFSSRRLGKLVEEEEKRENHGCGPILRSST